MKKIWTLLLVAFAALTVVSCEQEPLPGKLVGDVSYQNRGLVGVTVTLTSETETFSTTTIADGFFKFEELPAGDYIVSCNYNGYTPEVYFKYYEKSENPRLVTVLAGDIHTRNVIIPSTEDIGLGGDDDDED